MCCARERGELMAHSHLALECGNAGGVIRGAISRVIGGVTSGVVGGANTRCSIFGHVWRRLTSHKRLEPFKNAQGETG